MELTKIAPSELKADVWPAVQKADVYTERVCTGQGQALRLGWAMLEHATIASALGSEFLNGTVLPVLNLAFLAKDVGNVPGFNERVVNMAGSLWKAVGQA